MTSCSKIPVELVSFFKSAYGIMPLALKGKGSTLYSAPEFEGVQISTDPHGGCHLDVKFVNPEIDHRAKQAIQQLAEGLRASKTYNSLWINLDLPSSPALWGRIVPESFVIGEEGKGDLIKDVQRKKIRIWQWLNADKECAIPPGATHNCGATALIIDRTFRKVLLVEPMRRNAWNLPGGSFDPWKDVDLTDTAFREAQEEGGFELIKLVPHKPKLVGQLQFPNNPFAPAINQIWAFFIDRISQQALKPPAHEIKRAEWIDWEEIEKSRGFLRGCKLSDEIKSPLRAALHRYGFEEISNKGWMIVHTQKVPNVAKLYALLSGVAIRKQMRTAAQKAQTDYDKPLTEAEHQFIGSRSFLLKCSTHTLSLSDGPVIEENVQSFIKSSLQDAPFYLNHLRIKGIEQLSQEPIRQPDEIAAIIWKQIRFEIRKAYLVQTIHS